jgi:hypothetical protein
MHQGLNDSGYNDNKKINDFVNEFKSHLKSQECQGFFFDFILDSFFRWFYRLKVDLDLFDHLVSNILEVIEALKFLSLMGSVALLSSLLKKDAEIILCDWSSVSSFENLTEFTSSFNLKC